MSDRKFWFLGILSIATVAAVWFFAGCVAKDAVHGEATGSAKVTDSGKITGVDYHPATQPTSQESSSATSQQAGHDAEAWSFPINLSGSGWPIVAIAALTVAAIYLLGKWHRAGRTARREQTRTKTLATAIAGLPPGTTRDLLLTDVDLTMPDAIGWDKDLNRWGVRVKRSQDWRDRHR